jgi:hypothetical protein
MLEKPNEPSHIKALERKTEALTGPTTRFSVFIPVKMRDIFKNRFLGDEICFALVLVAKS